MRAVRDDVEMIAVVAEEPSEDALSGMTGVFNGLVIMGTIYAAAFGVWWVW